ncbi:MAG TPA: hypothetical protein VGD08_10755 [Stellaceae bacterium]
MTIDWIEIRCPCCRTLLLVALPAMKGPGAPCCEECGAALTATLDFDADGDVTGAAAEPSKAVPLVPA